MFAENIQEQFDRLWKRALDAVDHLDAGLASRILLELNRAFDYMAAQGIPIPQSQASFDSMKEDLLKVALPEIPLSDVVKVLSTGLLAFLRSDIHLGERLSVRYAYTIYGEHETERQAMKKAVLSNQEQIGTIKVGEWLNLFDKSFDPKTRDKNSIMVFISREPKVGRLNEIDKATLVELLSVYEDWLVMARLNMIDVAYLTLHPELAEESQNDNITLGQSRESQPSAKGEGIKRLPLLKAMSEYPRLGDQNITADRIKTKQSPEPMRGSLTNWIHYYRDELGIGFHDQVLRGKFLFQSENGKKLSSEEREHLNVILKSIEEEFPLEIDTDRQVILFPVPQAREMSERREPIRTAAAQPTPQPVSWAIPKPSPAFTFGKPGVISPRVNPAPRPAAAVPRATLSEADMKPTANIADATLHFSTGHVLPAEKAALGAQAAPSTVAPTVKNTVSHAPAGSGQRIVSQPNPSRSPYSIRPLRPRE